MANPSRVAAGDALRKSSPRPPALRRQSGTPYPPVGGTILRADVPKGLGDEGGQGRLRVASGSALMAAAGAGPRRWERPRTGPARERARPMTTTLPSPSGRPRTTGATTRPGATSTASATSQAVVDGALLLPRAVVATRALLTGAGVETYRCAFPAGRTPAGRSPDGRCGRTTPVNRPSRIATHAVAGVLLGLLTVAVVVGLVAALLASPLLLAPAGGATLLAFAGIGAGHSALTRRLVDRT